MSRSRAPLVAATLTVLASLTAARAQPAAPVRLGVRELAAEVLRAHPALRASREDVAAARAERRQAGLWPNPEAEAEWADALWFGDEGERSGSLGISQRLPVAGRLARARDVARADVAISQRDSAALALQLVADAEREAVTVLALERAIGAREEALEATRALAQISARRFRAAETSEADVNLLEIEVSSLEQERELLRLERAAAVITLNRLLSRPPDAPLEIEGALEASLFEAAAADSIVANALRERPDLNRLQTEVARARAEARLARAEAWEDWGVGAAYEREVGTIDDAGLELRDRDNLLALSLRIPLPLWNRNQGRVAAAHARERAAAERLAAAEQTVRAEIATALERTTRLRALSESHQAAALARARRNVELLERGYAQGITPVSEIVQGQRQLADASARLAETLGALRRAEIELEAAAAASPLLRELNTQENQQ